MVPALISEAYRKQNIELHAASEIYGANNAKYAHAVMKLLQTSQSTTVLDYGCGKGALVRALQANGVPAKGYDPAVAEFSSQPEPADLVICTDVLEHVEPEYLEGVLIDLDRLTKKAIYLIVATTPAWKTLPDGRNAHLIQKSSTEWLYDLLPRFTLSEFMEGKRGFAAVMKK